jgi:hypothetical protein
MPAADVKQRLAPDDNASDVVRESQYSESEVRKISQAAHSANFGFDRTLETYH